MTLGEALPVSGEERVFAKSSEAKAAGWFSRRHRTNEAHEAAKAKRAAHKDAHKAREAAKGSANPQ